jgi:hypothetical protein
VAYLHQIIDDHAILDDRVLKRASYRQVELAPISTSFANIHLKRVAES